MNVYKVTLSERGKSIPFDSMLVAAGSVAVAAKKAEANLQRDGFNGLVASRVEIVTDKFLK